MVDKTNMLCARTPLKKPFLSSCVQIFISWHRFYQTNSQIRLWKSVWKVFCHRVAFVFSKFKLILWHKLCSIQCGTIIASSRWIELAYFGLAWCQVDIVNAIWSMAKYFAPRLNGTDWIFFFWAKLKFHCERENCHQIANMRVMKASMKSFVVNCTL